VRALGALQNLLVVRRGQVEMLGRHLQLLSPAAQLARQAERLRALRQRLASWWTLFRTVRTERLARGVAKLDSLSPLGILGRGYSICFALPGRRILKSATEAAVGSAVAVRLHAGELHCVVEGVHPPEDER
jgi:exodeoxyribonuclease VII large subunit